MSRRDYKYCVRFTEEERERIIRDMHTNGFLSMSSYMRDRLFRRHSGYVPGIRGTATLEKLVNRVCEAAMYLAEEGRKINLIAADVNRRKELNRDGSPVRFGGMATHWTRLYLLHASVLARKLENTKKMIQNYEKGKHRR